MPNHTIALLLAGDEETPFVQALLTGLEAHSETDGAYDKAHGDAINVLVSFRCACARSQNERVVNDFKAVATRQVV